MNLLYIAYMILQNIKMDFISKIRMNTQYMEYLVTQKVKNTRLISLSIVAIRIFEIRSC